MEAAKKEEPLAFLHLHLEPAQPIEVGELTAALASLSRQYQAFATAEGYGGKAAEARLLVASVSPGSIDINLLPELGPSMALLAVILHHGEVLARFVNVLGKTFDLFRGERRPGAGQVSVKDCIGRLQ